MKTPIVLIVILIIGFAAFVYFEDALIPASIEKPADEEMQTEEKIDENDFEVCIQVITPARNPETDEIQEFPTPCDVPEGWEPIEPEGLDLQVI